MWLSKDELKDAERKAKTELVKKWYRENPEKAKASRKRAQENYIKNNPEDWKEIQRNSRLKRMQNSEYKNKVLASMSLRHKYNKIFGFPETEKEREERLAYIEKNLENRIEEMKYRKSPEVKKAKEEKLLNNRRKNSRIAYRSKTIEERKLENKKTWIGKKRRSAIEEFKKVNSENEVIVLSGKEIQIPNNLQNLALLNSLLYKHGEYLKIEDELKDNFIILTFIEREDYLKKYLSENISKLKQSSKYKTVED